MKNKVKSLAFEKLRLNIRHKANVISMRLKTTIIAFKITSFRIGKQVFDWLLKYFTVQ